MGFNLSGSRSKGTQNTTEAYRPNDEFLNLTRGTLNNIGNLQYQGTTQDQINGFANPYLSQVGDATSAGLMRSRDVTGNTLDAQAAKAGAFGGSGWGLLRGENNRAYADAEASALAGINANGYQSALNAAQGESQAANQFGLQQMLAQLQGLNLLNFGTTTSNGKTTGSQLGFNAGFKYGG